MRICVVVPHYDHVEQFAVMLPALAAHGLPLIVVDDASPAEKFGRLEALLAEHAPGHVLVRHEANRGKGGAVMSGLEAAFEAGYSHALQVDADGQHDIDRIPALLERAGADPEALVCGRPVFDESVSALRYYSRYLTLYFCWLETLSREIEDALCGFRVYPLEHVLPVVKGGRLGERMAFDPEVLVRCVWAGIAVRYVLVHVQYPEGGRSHFRYVGDNVEISWMHTRLIAGMLLRLPRLVRRRLSDGRRRAVS